MHGSTLRSVLPLVAATLGVLTVNTPASAPASAPRTVKPGEVLIQGRLVGARKINTQSGLLWLHLVAQPAPDPYSHPETVEVEAKSRLGQKDDDISVLCRVGGRRRTFQMTDENGERITVSTADNKLRAVE